MVDGGGLIVIDTIAVSGGLVPIAQGDFERILYYQLFDLLLDSTQSFNDLQDTYVAFYLCFLARFVIL